MKKWKNATIPPSFEVFSQYGDALRLEKLKIGSVTLVQIDFLKNFQKYFTFLQKEKVSKLEKKAKPSKFKINL